MLLRLYTRLAASRALCVAMRWVSVEVVRHVDRFGDASFEVGRGTIVAEGILGVHATTQRAASLQRVLRIETSPKAILQCSVTRVSHLGLALLVEHVLLEFYLLLRLLERNLLTAERVLLLLIEALHDRVLLVVGIATKVADVADVLRATHGITVMAPDGLIYALLLDFATRRHTKLTVHGESVTSNRRLASPLILQFFSVHLLVQGVTFDLDSHQLLVNFS